jgi:hypothetical protein
MALLLFCLPPFLLFFLVWVQDIFKNRHPLNADEVFELARKKQWNHFLATYSYSSIPRNADPTAKKAMKASGQFVRCDLRYFELPSSVAGLLKYKKHEWVVLVFVKEFHAEYLWWNKGKDGTSVSPYLRGGHLENALRLYRPDTLIRLHNHPNPNPSKYRTNLPSQQDLKSAEYFSGLLSEKGISFLDFVCERGVPHLYFAFFNSSLSPVERYVEEISGKNNSGIFANIGLRRELALRTGNSGSIKGAVF